MRGVYFDSNHIEIRVNERGVQFTIDSNGYSSAAYPSYNDLIEMKKVLEKIIENAPPIVHICEGGLDDNL